MYCNKWAPEGGEKPLQKNMNPINRDHAAIRQIGNERSGNRKSSAMSQVQFPDMPVRITSVPASEP